MISKKSHKCYKYIVFYQSAQKHAQENLVGLLKISSIIFPTVVNYYKLYNKFCISHSKFLQRYTKRLNSKIPCVN